MFVSRVAAMVFVLLTALCIPVLVHKNTGACSITGLHLQVYWSMIGSSFCMHRTKFITVGYPENEQWFEACGPRGVGM